MVQRIDDLRLFGPATQSSALFSEFAFKRVRVGETCKGLIKNLILKMLVFFGGHALVMRRSSEARDSKSDRSRQALSD
jgi:hypothetical protein